ncbi:ADP-ribosyltransferase [Ligilactobacillus ruminis]|uniref:ADP-ribosyltransferase n=1 Tax=Ligilactobacillus ruminis TaxID=1623 RepID=UPI003F98C1CB
MTDDVLPELLKLVCDEFEKSYAANGIVKQVQKKLEDKSATYADAYEYAYEVGCMLSDALTKHVTNELLPNGTMYYNIAQRLLQKTLGTNYKLVSELAVGVQKVLNRKAGLTLAALKPDIDQDKVDGLIERLSKGDFENDKFVMGSPIANFTQSVVDDTIAKNVEFHASAGLHPKIVRRYAGNGCKWCANLAGTYNYPVKQEIYRRHDNCRCIVEYFPEDGRGVQNAHTKGWRNESKVERERIRKSKGDNGFRRKDSIQTAAEAEARALGYNPIPTSRAVEHLRKEARIWQKDLEDEEIRSINKYTYNGTDDDGKKLFFKINEYLEGRYSPRDEREEEIILRNSGFINEGISKFKLQDDIIVYRNDFYPDQLAKKNEKFLSASVVPDATLRKQANVAIIVPKGSNGAYIELLAMDKYKKQREFVINRKSDLNLLSVQKGMYIYELR